MSRVAAIDCGTNTIRLLIADVTVRDDGTRWLRDIHREVRVVRLGQGVDATGMFAQEALERTKVALTDYAVLIRRKGAERVRMVATSAARDVSNRDEFFAMTRALLGVEAEVITGDEEARLSFIGAVGDCDPDQGSFLVADIGGGSTELVLGGWDGVRVQIEAAHSVNIGSVRITERCLQGAPPSVADVEAAVALTSELLAPAFATVPVAKAATWLGVGATALTMSAVAQGLTEYDEERTHLSRVPVEQIRSICTELLSMTHQQIAALGPVHPGRVDVIAGGVLIARVLADYLAEHAGITELMVSEHDILDGVALSIA